MSAFTPGELVTFDFRHHALPYGIKEGIVLCDHGGGEYVGIQFFFDFDEGHDCRTTRFRGKDRHCRWVEALYLTQVHEPDWYIENNLPVPGV